MLKIAKIILIPEMENDILGHELYIKAVRVTLAK